MPPPPLMVKMPMQPPPEFATIQSCPVCTPGLKELPGLTVPASWPLPLGVRYQTWMLPPLLLTKENPTDEPLVAEPIDPYAEQPWELAPVTPVIVCGPGAGGVVVLVAGCVTGGGGDVVVAVGGL